MAKGYHGAHPAATPSTAGNLQLRGELLVVERRMIERAFAIDLAHT
jgi:hypothetical protein